MSDLRMPDLNRVTIAGRLTRDPELKYTAAGKPWCHFSIANTRRYRIQGGEGYQEETTFVEVTQWGAGAEYTGQKLGKGAAVIVEGRLHTYEWEDRQSGQKRNRLDIQAERVAPLEWNDKTPAVRERKEQSQGGGGQHGGGGYDDPPPEDDIPF